MYLPVALVAAVAAAVPGCARAAAARAAGMRVPRLLLGFGPLLAIVPVGRTKLQLHAIPLGAFSQIAGLHALDEPVSRDAPDAFANRPLATRLLVLFAGALGLLVAAITLSVAHDVIWGERSLSSTPIVDAVLPERPADRAGLRAGDQLLAVDGRAIDGVTGVATAIDATRGPARLLVRRDGRELTLTIDPELADGHRRIGIQLSPGEQLTRPPLGRAVADGVLYPLRLAGFMLRSGAELLSGRAGRVMAGPIGIIAAARKSAPDVDRAVMLAVMLLVNATLLMLMPVPPFDGGRALARLLRRRPRTIVAARRLADVDAAPSPLGALDVSMLTLLTLATLLTVANPPLCVALVIACVGLWRRRAAAWSIAATLAPGIAGSGVLIALGDSHVERVFALGFTLAWIALALWLYSRGLRARLGLACPACGELQARAVVGSDDAMGCLACGSCWRRVYVKA
jgi:membrane-associated protease RseP (regulator of RpoE activity)